MRPESEEGAPLSPPPVRREPSRSCPESPAEVESLEDPEEEEQREERPGHLDDNPVHALKERHHSQE